MYHDEDGYPVLEAGDWCEDCRTTVASDGECECNQDEDDEETQ